MSVGYAVLSQNLKINGTLIYYERQGNETSVVVPAEVNGIKITKIAAHAFLDNVDAINIFSKGYVIGTNSAKYEEAEALAAQYGMNFITIDEYLEYPPFEFDFLTEVYGNNFAHMTIDYTLSEPAYFTADKSDNHYLVNLDLSEMVHLEEIGKYAARGYEGKFDECPNSDDQCGLGKLTTLKLPMNGVLHTIGEKAFENNQLTTIQIPTTLITIENHSFQRNNLINDITIPKSVITIGTSAFEDNLNLMTITIKRADSVGMTLRADWNYKKSDGTRFEVIYDPS